ncbi:MAG: rhamnulose-1-phosphate aldolase [Bacteroidales bacterium]|nr:rhamnulose-1-phosphate aldolase [Bacteroidales bacterium]
MKEVINQVAEVAGYLWQKGWAERNGGNITVNITDCVDNAVRSLPPLLPAIAIGKQLPFLKGQFFYAKGTGKRMRDLARRPMDNGSIIRICDDCEHYEIVAEHPVLPTSELPSHLEIQNYLMASGTRYKATLHTHPIELVAMSHSKQWLDSHHLTQVLWSMIPETLAFAPLGIGVVPYALPGSILLAESTLEQIKQHDVVLWEKHGVFAVGEDIMEAFDQVDVLNKAAVLYMTACNMGFTPDGMSQQSVQEIQQVFHLPTHR